MSHALPECAHEWGGWHVETRVVESGTLYVLTRTCIKCEVVDELDFGRDT